VRSVFVLEAQDVILLLSGFVVSAFTLMNFLLGSRSDCQLKSHLVHFCFNDLRLVLPIFYTFSYHFCRFDPQSLFCPTTVLVWAFVRYCVLYGPFAVNAFGILVSFCMFSVFQLSPILTCYAFAFYSFMMMLLLFDFDVFCAKNDFVWSGVVFFFYGVFHFCSFQGLTDASVDRPLRVWLIRRLFLFVFFLFLYPFSVGDNALVAYYIFCRYIYKLGFA